MYTLMIVVFVLGYLGIALEHNIHVDKAASALLTGVLMWTLLVFGADQVFDVDFQWSLAEFQAHAGDFVKNLNHYISGVTVAGNEENTQQVLNHFIGHELEHHVIEIAEILFFLIGAMTIVEIIDAHEGFSVVTDRIQTTKKAPLLIVLSILTFFFSAALDNLTTAIVMAALLKKLIRDKEDLWMFAGVIIIAANAGGAWSPIGDVTTIMLWIGGQITAMNIVTSIIVPSLVALAIPLAIQAYRMRNGNVRRPETSDYDDEVNLTTDGERKTVFFLGVFSLLQVPIHKTLTHLPPFMGVLLGLGMMWALTEILHRRKSAKAKTKLSVTHVLRKIDTPSILFFLGILLAVGSLQSAGHLVQLARGLESQIGNIYAINVVIGVLSSIVDNVPLVAAAMGMYEIGPEVAGQAYPVDHEFWEFLAYCAGTGGSCLIIGSAAGVAVMGILRMNFVWYLKKITLLALVGYLAGAAVYILQNTMM